MNLEKEIKSNPLRKKPLFSSSDGHLFVSRLYILDKLRHFLSSYNFEEIQYLYNDKAHVESQYEKALEIIGKRKVSSIIKEIRRDSKENFYINLENLIDLTSELFEGCLELVYENNRKVTSVSIYDYLDKFPKLVREIYVECVRVAEFYFFANLNGQAFNVHVEDTEFSLTKAIQKHSYNAVKIWSTKEYVRFRESLLNKVQKSVCLRNRKFAEENGSLQVYEMFADFVCGFLKVGFNYVEQSVDICKERIYDAPLDCDNSEDKYGGYLFGNYFVLEDRKSWSDNSEVEDMFKLKLALSNDVIGFFIKDSISQIRYCSELNDMIYYEEISKHKEVRAFTREEHNESKLMTKVYFLIFKAFTEHTGKGFDCDYWFGKHVVPERNGIFSPY